MKIVFLNIYQGINQRGAERSTYELVKRLAKKQEIILISGGKDRDIENYCKNKIIKPLITSLQDTSFSFWRRYYLDLWSLNILIFTIKALFYLVKEKTDIIIPLNGGWQVLILRLFSWILRIKLVVIGRAGIGRDDRWNLFWQPDCFIALTTKAEEWAKKINPTLKIVKIPNGVDLNTFKPEGEIAGLDLKQPIIVTASALTPNKRIDLTINAIAKLANVSLLVLGNGFQRDYLRTLGKKLLGNNRFLIKEVEMAEIAKYYRVGKLFTLVSIKEEAFGNVYLEALACNLPVVATDDEARREIIGKSGIFVDPKNIDNYSQVLSRGLKKNFGNIPRLQAEKFAWERIVKDYEKVFESLS